jgi:hypothetical protein
MGEATSGEQSKKSYPATVNSSAISEAGKAINYDLAGFGQGNWNPGASDLSLFIRLEIPNRVTTEHARERTHNYRTSP